MKIGLLEVKSKKKGCINKDFMGGYGWAFNAGNGVLARMINIVKKAGERLPVMSFGYLTSIFRAKGHDVIYAENSIPDADIIFIQSSMVDYRYEIEWARKIKGSSRIVGFIGPFSSVMPGLFMDSSNFIIKGEPEEAAMRIADGAKAEGLIESSFIENLDTIPFPNWDIFPYRKFSYFPALKEKPFFPILSSRGCPHKCNYCPYLVIYKWRERSTQNVLQEIDYLVQRYDMRTFLFRDPLFSLNRQRAFDIAKGLIERNYNLKWACETRLDCLDKDLVKIFYDSGLRVINVGIESYSEDTIRKATRKPVDIEYQEEIVNYCDKLGIRITAFYMFGMPDDTMEGLADTIKYAKKLNTHVAQFFIFTPFPGTSFFNSIKSDIFNVDWERFDCYTPIFRHKNISAEDISMLKEKAFVSYYFRINWFKRFFRTAVRDIFNI